MKEPLRVLIVEDEAIQREALAVMCHRALDGATVETAEAADGAAALARAAAFNPDVVLMDIRMPEVDGLEGARRLLGAGRPAPPVVVFVTAYDDFAYTRQALCLGAADYLLKPVSLDELRRVLLAAAQRVEAGRREARQSERVARRLKAALPLLRLELLQDLAAGTLVCPQAEAGEAAAELGNRLELAGVGGQPSLGILFDLEPEARRASLAETAALQQQVRSALGRTLRRHLGTAWLLGPTGPGRLTLVLEPPGGRREASVRERALALAADLKAEAERLAGGPVSAGVGEEHPETGGLVLSLREAAAALAARAQAGPGCLAHVADVRATAAAVATGAGPAPAPLGPLLENIRLGQVDQAGREASRLVAVVASGHGTAGLAGVYAAEVITATAQAALEAGAEPREVRRLEARSLHWAGQLAGEAGADYERTLVAFAREAAGLSQAAQASHQGGIVRRALAYVQANYGRALTLEDVAREVHVSHYYLSHLLRRESGKSFTDHLTELRVGRARELLATTDLGVNEVATRAGFTDGNYFARVFKRATGRTPSAYRRQARPATPAVATPVAGPAAAPVAVTPRAAATGTDQWRRRQ